MPQELPPLSISAQGGDRQILICHHHTCRERGSTAVLRAFQQHHFTFPVEVLPSPCLGQCHLGVTVRLVPAEIWYCHVTPADVPQICTTLQQGSLYCTKLNPRFYPQGQ
ncbi:(2Fe-2S) ferredoxin domain-containing protein [Synechococcus moorigangaii CMS01]|nr:(2Fe-2S) ferredoxin domain-containing protein [Synechococcus moorigangaii CMS01]